MSENFEYGDVIECKEVVDIGIDDFVEQPIKSNVSIYPDSKIALENILNKLNISTDKWDKSIDSLYEEIKEKECCLKIIDLRLYRHVNVLRIKCYYENDDNEKFILIEQKQVFNNGKVRIRNFDYVAEKIKEGKDLNKEVCRALDEELSIKLDIQQINKDESFHSTEECESPSYNGIMGVYNYYNYNINIKKSQYRSSYKEVQSDKSTYFIWKKI